MEELKSLIEDAQKGNLEAYGKIIHRFHKMVFCCAFEKLHDYHLAEDVEQQVFVQAYKSLPDLRAAEAFPVWLRRIISKYCDRISRRKQLPMIPLEDAGHVGTTEMSPDKILINKELEKRIMEAVAALPEKQRKATTLHYVDGYSQKEVAEFMEVPLTTVKKRLHQAKKGIRAIMLYKEKD